MTQVAYPTNGKRKEGTLFAFGAHSQAIFDTRRLQQIQKELRQLSPKTLRDTRQLWSKPPMSDIAWVRELLPYLDGLIKERTPAVPLPKKQHELQVDDLREEVALLRKELNAVIKQFTMAPLRIDVAESKPLPPPRQHAKGKKRRLIGPIGELVAVVRPWLNYGVTQAGKKVVVYAENLREKGIDPKRFRNSISATAYYFYGRRSITTQLLRNCDETVAGVAFTFIGSTKPIRPLNVINRTDTHPVSIDQSTPT